jgi:hypothetical protein
MRGVALAVLLGACSHGGDRAVPTQPSPALATGGVRLVYTVQTRHLRPAAEALRGELDRLGMAAEITIRSPQVIVEIPGVSRDAVARSPLHDVVVRATGVEPTEAMIVFPVR